MNFNGSEKKELPGKDVIIDASLQKFPEIKNGIIQEIWMVY